MNNAKYWRTVSMLLAAAAFLAAIAAGATIARAAANAPPAYGARFYACFIGTAASEVRNGIEDPHPSDGRGIFEEAVITAHRNCDRLIPKSLDPKRRKALIKEAEAAAEIIGLPEGEGQAEEEKIGPGREDKEGPMPDNQE